MSILLEHGANPNIANYCGDAALHYAVYDNNVPIAEKLLFHNVHIEAKSKVGIEMYFLNMRCSCLKDGMCWVSFLPLKA